MSLLDQFRRGCKRFYWNLGFPEGIIEYKILLGRLKGKIALAHEGRGGRLPVLDWRIFLSVNCKGKREGKSVLSCCKNHKEGCPLNVDRKCLSWLSLTSSCNALYGALSLLDKVASSLGIHFGMKQTCAQVSASLWLWPPNMTVKQIFCNLRARSCAFTRNLASMSGLCP